ncbi:MAG TPA: hypothetical protein VJU87_03630 [Gemmatimonadaceae bacterium]|nr:hypothetical protein [Gemmatimonadaceae bacterium]
MSIALSSLLLADPHLVICVASDSRSPGDTPRDRGEERPDPNGSLDPERLSELRRRVLTGRYDLPDAILLLARRLLDVLR